MTVDLSRVVGNAVSIAQHVGVTATATITRPAPPPNPLTGVQSGSPVTQTVSALQAESRRYVRKDDAVWTQARVVLFVAAIHAQWTPKRGDQCTWAGLTSVISGIEEYAPSGSAIGWFLAIGAARGGPSRD